MDYLKSLNQLETVQASLCFITKKRQADHLAILFRTLRLGYLSSYVNYLKGSLNGI